MVNVLGYLSFGIVYTGVSHLPCVLICSHHFFAQSSDDLRSGGMSDRAIICLHIYLWSYLIVSSSFIWSCLSCLRLYKVLSFVYLISYVRVFPKPNILVRHGVLHIRCFGLRIFLFCFECLVSLSRYIIVDMYLSLVIIFLSFDYRYFLDGTFVLCHLFHHSLYHISVLSFVFDIFMSCQCSKFVNLDHLI